MLLHPHHASKLAVLGDPRSAQIVDAMLMAGFGSKQKARDLASWTQEALDIQHFSTPDPQAREHPFLRVASHVRQQQHYGHVKEDECREVSVAKGEDVEAASEEGTWTSVEGEGCDDIATSSTGQGTRGTGLERRRSLGLDRPVGAGAGAVRYLIMMNQCGGSRTWGGGHMRRTASDPGSMSNEYCNL
jgi:hypothetical protein